MAPLGSAEKHICANALTWKFKLTIKTAIENSWVSAKHQRELGRTYTAITNSLANKRKAKLTNSHLASRGFNDFCLTKFFDSHRLARIQRASRRSKNSEWCDFLAQRLALGDVSDVWLRVGYFQSVRDMKAPILSRILLHKNTRKCVAKVMKRINSGGLESNRQINARTFDACKFQEFSSFPVNW